MEIHGVLVGKYPTQQITDTFQKREFIVKTLEQYPQEIKLELSQDKVTLIDQYKKGDVIKCKINIRGKRFEKEGKVTFFNSIHCWGIELDQSIPNAQQNDFPDPPVYNTNPEDDDLPF